VLATHMFGKAKIAETTADNPEKLINRNVEVSMQELTNDFSKSHIKLKFKIVKVTGMEAHTVYAGHSLTTDYVKRMSRKHKSKVDGVFKVVTQDGVPLRIKPSAMAGKRIQSSQKRAIRAIVKQEVEKAAQTHDFDEFIKFMLDGDLGKEAYHQSKTIYPIKRVEIYKSETLEIPTVTAVTEAREEAALVAAAAAEESTEEETAEAPSDEQTSEEKPPTTEGPEPNEATVEEKRPLEAAETEESTDEGISDEVSSAEEPSPEEEDDTTTGAEEVDIEPEEATEDTEEVDIEPEEDTEDTDHEDKPSAKE